jgi:ubiquinone/menaquinone biosynthesis C-methylase UbiE
MTSIEEKVFFEIHTGLSREGPGSRRTTQRAFHTIQGLPPSPNILDIGCGPGTQTLHLAEMSAGKIYAIDNHKPFIERLGKAVKRRKLINRVFPLLANMHQLSFKPGFFDLMWAEGSIYIIGVEEGLVVWRPLISKKGFIAFTEVSWLKNDPPKQLQSFWKEAYPAISSRKKNENKIRRTGYSLVHQFVLPESDWWSEYYTPIEAKLEKLKIKYRKNAEALAVLDTEEKEIELYRRFAEYYGYVFYIAQKSNS